MAWEKIDTVVDTFAIDGSFCSRAGRWVAVVCLVLHSDPSSALAQAPNVDPEVQASERPIVISPTGSLTLDNASCPSICSTYD